MRNVPWLTPSAQNLEPSFLERFLNDGFEVEAAALDRIKDRMPKCLLVMIGQPFEYLVNVPLRMTSLLEVFHQLLFIFAVVAHGRPFKRVSIVLMPVVCPLRIRAEINCRF